MGKIYCKAIFKVRKSTKPYDFLPTHMISYQPLLYSTIILYDTVCHEQLIGQLNSLVIESYKAEICLAVCSQMLSHIPLHVSSKRLDPT